MDVGLIVDDSAMYSTLFALLACIALAVELGRRPAKPKKMAAQEETGEDDKEKHVDGKADKSKVTANSPSPAPGVTMEDIPVRPFIHDQNTSTESFEEMAVRRATEVQDALADLQRTYVDGLLAPRGKYDVALAILNEYQAASSLSEKDVGLTMATEAYLSATRSGAIGSGRSRVAQGGESNTERAADKSTSDSTAKTKPEKKGATAEKSKPPAKGGKAKKTNDTKKPK